MSGLHTRELHVLNCVHVCLLACHLFAWTDHALTEFQMIMSPFKKIECPHAFQL